MNYAQEKQKKKLRTFTKTNEERSRESAAAFKLFRGQESKVGRGGNLFVIIAPQGKK